MTQLVVFIAGLLVVAESQASDVADSSRFQGFLSHGKFITPSVNSAKHGNRVDALSSQVQDLPKVADREESNNPISSSVIGMGLLSLVTMLGLHLRRRVQPAMSTASALGDNLMEMKSQDSHKMSSSKVGWGQLSSQNTRPSTLCYATETKADLEEIAKGLNPVVGYWDPLNVGGASQSLYSYNNEQTIAWYRQAEIKHGRIAMAAFVGYCVQANGIHWGTKMTLGGADWPTGTPPEQWDALPVASKWQIILFIGMLELFDESIEPHYMMGRKPGEYPKFSTAYMEGRGFPHPVPFDLFDPFGTVKKYLDTPEKRARGRLVEINNGRAAMLGIFGFLAASKVPGSVPALTFIPPYEGNYMVPFEGNFHLGGM
jgi:hypothetical protein